MNGLKIVSTGRCLPQKKVTNEDLTHIVDTSDEWIRSRSGIENRYYCVDENGVQLATGAARQALADAGVQPEQVGACVVATVSPDWTTPSTACLVAANLGLPECIPCFDLAAACSGFLYALRTVQGLLTAERPYGLIVGCEVLSRVTDFTDRTTCVLFGDGAGAALVRLDAEATFAATLGARGNLNALSIAGPSVQGGSRIAMDGKAVYQFAVETIPRCVQQVLDDARLTLDDVDWVVCHQANARIIDSAIRRLKADPAKFYKNISRFGNTSSASIPVALDEMARQGLLRSGSKIICVGFGGGLTWAGVLISYESEKK